MQCRARLPPSSPTSCPGTPARRSCQAWHAPSRPAPPRRRLKLRWGCGQAGNGGRRRGSGGAWEMGKMQCCYGRKAELRVPRHGYWVTPPRPAASWRRDAGTPQPRPSRCKSQQSQLHKSSQLCRQLLPSTPHPPCGLACAACELRLGVPVGRFDECVLAQRQGVQNLGRLMVHDGAVCGALREGAEAPAEAAGCSVLRSWPVVSHLGSRSLAMRVPDMQPPGGCQKGQKTQLRQLGARCCAAGQLSAT